MFIRRYVSLVKDPLWSRVLAISLTLFFVFLADAILSYWTPNLIQNSLKSSASMGFILSFSSVIGFAADLVFPQILRKTKVTIMILFAIITSILFSTNLFVSTYFPLISLFLLAMAIWGFYYEFLGFASQQFVADSVPLKSRSGAWAIIGIFKNLAYFLGPIFGGWLLLRGDRHLAIVSIIISLISLIILSFVKRTRDSIEKIDFKEVNLVKEFEHWAVLFKHVWPVVIISLILGLIDAFFWTTGATWTEEMSKQSFWGSMFLPFYTLPSLFVGFAVFKWGIYKGKKKTAEVFLLLSGLFLAGLGLSDLISIRVVFVLIASTMLSVTYPLIDGTYSDIISRMGRERKHLIGLSASTISLAYIIGPALAGLMSQAYGEKMTFVYLGLATFIASLILLIFTPRKLKLPQKEIEKWD